MMCWCFPNVCSCVALVQRGVWFCYKLLREENECILFLMCRLR